MGITQQSAAARLIQPGVIANASERPASPYEGQCIFQKDTDQLLVWNGTAWVVPNAPAQNPTGLELIVNGVFTTVSSASPASVSDCFSSIYNNYRVIINVDTVSTDATRTINLRWRTSSGDDNTSIYNYGSQMSQIGSSTFDVVNVAYGATETKLHSVYYTTQNGSSSLDVFNPFVSSKITSATGIVRGGTAAADTLGVFSTITTTAKSHTGFSIYPTTGTMTGTYAVYGYRK